MCVGEYKLPGMVQRQRLQVGQCCSGLQAAAGVCPHTHPGAVNPINKKLAPINSMTTHPHTTALPKILLD